ncbi:arsenic resistance N-acetyltransferase ArsN2 [Burkholderia stagnalis]|uniref:arsenic resistance N-acetyltransferase ArsN2 n=1 Tax=Burkholderia stagnalis TaxID=1503054 RepID=UPI00075FE426|nr:arsenic resistance N-acetyltransferase ArsN2 [Burkholderia stagnalis]KWK67544.1 GCN5 family acetyltransferase [Burkholderia stagnalis]
MHFRSAVVSDLASIEELLRINGLPTEGVAEHMTNFVVAEELSAVVGCGGIEYYDNFALIRSVAVAEHARDSGLGKSIVSHLLTACRAHAVQSVCLLTTTAEEYFAGLGFVRVARHEVPHSLLASSQFQGVCPGSATAMLMAL